MTNFENEKNIYVLAIAGSMGPNTNSAGCQDFLVTSLFCLLRYLHNPSIHPSIHPMTLRAHIGPRPPLARVLNLTLIDNW
jgi:hypothetical protein